MSRTYTFRQPVIHRHYRKLKRLLAIVAVLLIAIIAVVAYLYIQSRKSQPNQAATSQVEQLTVAGAAFTTVSDYFKFSDNGKWVLKSDESNANKFVYRKYRGEELEHSLYIYVNKEPPSSELEATRVLPVRIVNNNSFDQTTVSDECGKQYKAGEPLQVKPVSLNGTTIICRPDTAQYVVVVAAVGGDWRLHLQRPDKTPITFQIIFRDTGRNAPIDDLIRVVSTFQAT